MQGIIDYIISSEYGKYIGIGALILGIIVLRKIKEK